VFTQNRFFRSAVPSLCRRVTGDISKILLCSIYSVSMYFYVAIFFYFINQFYKNSILFGSDICTKRAQNRSCRVWSQNIEGKTWQGTKIFWPNWAPTQHWTNFWTKEELKFDVERISSNGIWGQWEMQNRYQAYFPCGANNTATCRPLLKIGLDSTSNFIHNFWRL
jgi:hypothetical protein